jgi:hypothetical protein
MKATVISSAINTGMVDIDPRGKFTRPALASFNILLLLLEMRLRLYRRPSRTSRIVHRRLRRERQH